MPVPVISVAQMREWEKATWAGGQSEAEVIRRVGRAIAEHALRLTRANDFILVLAGRGNNGADARNCLEHLDERRVDLLDVKDPESDFAKLERAAPAPAGIDHRRPVRHRPESSARRGVDQIHSMHQRGEIAGARRGCSFRVERG